MSGWKLTDGLANLRAQVNAAFPDRDKASDGTIGDAAHQAETSSHNPDDTSGSSPEWDGDSDSTPEVRAWDMDSDLRAAPATAQQVVDHIRHLPNVSSVLRYIIYNRKIYKAANGWAAETYTGPSAHTEHIHFTGAFTQAADNNTTFDYRLEDINMPSVDDIAQGVASKLHSDLKDPASGISKDLDARDAATRAQMITDLYNDLKRGPELGANQSGLNKIFRGMVAAEVAAQLAPIQTLLADLQPVEPATPGA